MKYSVYINDCSIVHKFRQGIVMQFIITLLGEQSDVNTFFAKTAMLNNLWHFEGYHECKKVWLSYTKVANFHKKFTLLERKWLCQAQDTTLCSKKIKPTWDTNDTFINKKWWLNIKLNLGFFVNMNFFKSRNCIWIEYCIFIHNLSTV